MAVLLQIDRQRGEARGPEVLHRPLPGPVGGGDVVVLVGLAIRRGVELVEGFDHETVGAQDADPLAVAGVELDPAAGPLQPVQRSLRPQEALLRVALLLWYAERGQDAVGQEHQPPARAEQPCRLCYPAFGIAPDAGAVLADHQVETRVREWHVLGVALNQGEDQTRALLAAARGVQLRGSEVDADRPGALPGEQGRQVRGAAAQLDHIQPADVAEDAQVAFGTWNSPQVISFAAQARSACSSVNSEFTTVHNARLRATSASASGNNGGLLSH